MTPPLLADVALMYGILVGINIPASSLGLEFDGSGSRLWYAPPGWVIALVWFVLFAMLAFARYNVRRHDPKGRGQSSIVALAVLCATYAYYTLGLSELTGVSALWFGLAGNVAVIMASLAVARKLRRVSARAALLVLPVAVWTAYATAIVLGEMKAQGLI